MSDDSQEHKESSAKVWGMVAGIVVLALVFSAFPCRISESAEQNGRAEPQNESLAQTTRLTIPVEGMSCGSCAASIKRATKAIAGVSDVRVDLVQRQAQVEYDAAKASPEKIRTAIEGLGYRTGTPVVERR